MGHDPGGVGITGTMALAPLQDFLSLHSDARMNYPGRMEGNWTWRVRHDQITPGSHGQDQQIEHSDWPSMIVERIAGTRTGSLNVARYIGST